MCQPCEFLLEVANQFKEAHRIKQLSECEVQGQRTDDGCQAYSDVCLCGYSDWLWIRQKFKNWQSIFTFFVPICSILRQAILPTPVLGSSTGHSNFFEQVWPSLYQVEFKVPRRQVPGQLPAHLKKIRKRWKGVKRKDCGIKGGRWDEAHSNAHPWRQTRFLQHLLRVILKLPGPHPIDES